MVQEFNQGRLLMYRIGNMGRFGNNAYVIADATTRDAIVVDAPEESEKILPYLKGLNVQRIAMTHRHADHWAGLDTVLREVDCPICCHAEDVTGRAVQSTLSDGELIQLGAINVQVLFTPGHTPGSICFVAGSRLISGDTLFLGGPGRTSKPEDLKQELESIRSKLFVLPDATVVHPGHGEDTTIGDAKREYAVFASREHPADLHGDVTWLNS
jgi:glyoxylase-like metal-dependent hydrolase (beta-lactamase superfamily II)